MVDQQIVDQQQFIHFQQTTTIFGTIATTTICVFLRCMVGDSEGGAI